ncbi:MAG: hypothetical protein SX243_08565 [Acidobacteriota bacterium]|nr:hypothetical protein [Acidobacteriota bacterium]
MRPHLRAWIVLATAALAVAGPALGQSGDWSYSGSLQLASGDYSLSETTRSLLLYSGLTYETGAWTLSASLPLIDQDSPYITYAGGTPVPSGRRLGQDGDSSGTDGTGSGSSMGSGRGGRGVVEVPDPDTLDFDQTGVGDPLLRLDWRRAGDSAGPRFGVYGAVKPPLADEDSGFGTGEWDYGAGLTLANRLGRSLLLADLGYWVYGDLPDLELEDGLSYSLGLGRSWAEGRYSALASIFGATEIIDGAEAPLQASLTLNRSLGAGTKAAARSLSLTVGAGLSDASPDFSIAAGWRIRWSG